MDREVEDQMAAAGSGGGPILGIIYAKQNKISLAIGALERFVALAPANREEVPAAKKKLAELKRIKVRKN